MPKDNDPIVTIEKYNAMTDEEKDIQDKKMILFLMGDASPPKYESMTIDEIFKAAFPAQPLDVSRYILRKYYAAHSASLNPNRPPSIY